VAERPTTARERRLVEERAGGHCEYCLTPLAYSPDPFAVEHIVPRARGGSHRPTNLAFSCLGCNSYKQADISALDAVSGEQVPLYDPRRHEWQEHFAWNEECTLLLGLTPTGRATIAKLALNREGVVNLRELLHSVGLHPPAHTLVAPPGPATRDAEEGEP
jgi:5-methylcytosine-specific restriction endonuclease McrA